MRYNLLSFVWLVIVIASYIFSLWLDKVQHLF